MNSSAFPRLQAIFYSEFDPIQGPKINYEIPESSITGVNKLFDFDLISDYIIPKIALCEHLITIEIDQHKVVGYPITIKNRKYERNALMFNLCWVFDYRENTKPYEPIITKMAQVLKSMEIEIEFLSNRKKRDVLLPALEHILEDLNTMCESRITLFSMGIINLKLFPNYTDPKPFELYHVPSPLANLNNLMDSTWDISVKKIIPYIDGINHVKKITQLSEVDPTLVRKALEHLLYYGCISMIDIFQYSNIYTVNPNLKDIIQDIYLQKECINYVSGPDQDIPQPTFSKILSLYCALRPGEPLLKWIDINQVEYLNLDVRRFITFGVLNKIIFRIHKYPILEDERNGVLPNNLKRFLNGRHHYDEICTEFSYTPNEMDRLLGLEPGVKFLFK